MFNKNYSLIPVIVAIVIIPQLLFWWLAPSTADSYMAVYVGSTILTIAVPVAAFMTYWFSNLRRSAGLFVVSGILEILTISLAILLLGTNASVRTAIFSMVITALVCSMVLIPMIHSVLKSQRQGVIPDPITSDLGNYTETYVPEPATRVQPHYSVPVTTARQTASVGTPLPPRNR